MGTLFWICSLASDMGHLLLHKAASCSRDRVIVMHRHGSSFKPVLDKLETYSVHSFLSKHQHQVMKSQLKEISARYTLSWMGFLGKVYQASPCRLCPHIKVLLALFGYFWPKQHDHVYCLSLDNLWSGLTIAYFDMSHYLTSIYETCIQGLKSHEKF